MSADLGLSSRWSALEPLRSVWQGGGGSSGLARTQFLWLRRRPCSCLFPAVAAAAAAAAAAMKEGNTEEVKEIGLDRAKFKEKLRLRAIRIPKEHAHFISKALHRFTLERPKLKHVIHDPESSENRLVLLAEHTNESDILEEKLTEIRKSLPLDIIPHEIDLDYRYFSVEQVLKEILPEGWKVPASFETVGHIAHLNLTDELLPYRKIIAEVFLDKNQPNIKTIVNKVGTISNEFRVPTWEVLAGGANLVTEVKQHNAIFRLDFGLVYWNSRLEFEHKRLCSHFQPGQVILDMFAGIGPFAIPAAQRGCVVFANDLNPASVQYLKVNSKINKVAANIEAYNMDARAFMKNLLRREDRGKVEDEGYNGSSAAKSILPRVDSVTPLAEDSEANSIGFRSVSVSARLSSEYEVTPTASENSAHILKQIMKLFRDKEQKLNQGVVTSKARTRRELNVSSIAKSEVKPWEQFHHVVMNLPASAIEFLDVFEGLLSRDLWKGPMPRVHCYCFMRASETTGDVVKLVESVLIVYKLNALNGATFQIKRIKQIHAENILGGKIQDPHVWTVRDVAPNKIMLCISFDLSEQVGFGEAGLAKQSITVDTDNPESEQQPSAQCTHSQPKRLRTET